LVLGTILATITLVFAPKAHAAYSYYRSITVTSTASVASGTLSNFPMLVSSTLSSWKSSGNGGHIQNLVTAPNGGTEPADLVFATSSANCTAGAYLNFETENYVSSTGALVDWVNVPSMSMGTVIYACYDNSSITTDQSHPSSTWNSNYLAVYHLVLGNPAISTSTFTTASLMDSTANSNNLANNGTSVSQDYSYRGIIPGGGAALNTLSSDSFVSYLENTSTLKIPAATNITIEAWASIFGGYDGGFDFENTTPSQAFYDLWPFGNTMYWSYGSQRTSAVVTNYNTAWNDYVMTALGNGTNESIWENGTNIVSTSVASAPTATSSDLRIGVDNGGNVWGAYTEEFRISKVVLSPSWILTEYNNEKSPDDSQGTNGFYHVGSETAMGGGASLYGGGLVAQFVGRIFQFAGGVFQFR
jgi:biopolymer transport protein ExbB